MRRSSLNLLVRVKRLITSFSDDSPIGKYTLFVPYNAFISSRAGKDVVFITNGDLSIRPPRSSVFQRHRKRLRLRLRVARSTKYERLARRS